MGKRPRRPQLPKRAKYTEKHFRPYVIAIGQVAPSWNDLCNRLGNLFWILLGAGFSEVPLAVWNSVPSDRSQRKMLRDMAKVAVRHFSIDEKYPSAADDIKWLIGEAEKLEDTRNDAIHSPLLTFPPLSGGGPDQAPALARQIIPDFGLGNPRARKLAEKDLLAEFRWCRDTAIVLRDYCDRVADALLGPPKSWPQRPRLPARQRPSSHASHQTHPKAPRRRPRSSPA